MKVFLDSIGCRLNQSEIETMAQQLIASGHEIVDEAAQADRIVLNTCAVTREATRDTRNRTRRFNRANDSAEIILTGCHATISPEKVKVLPGVSHVVANKDKHSLIHKIDPQAALELPMFDREPIIREFMAGGIGNTRAFIKVQDGCKNRCTFCITTIARGDGVSRHIGDVVAEIQALSGAGYQEAVLTGVHLGSYGHDFGNMAGLQDLVRMVLEHTDIARLRLSSLEPWDIPDDFFTLWENPRLLPHLHMPLQAGCDATLRRMARRTTKEMFNGLVRDARACIPNLNLTTDMIVGFPGETDADFEESLAYVEEIGFSRLHAFTYSAREGTAAATMPNHLPKQIKKERVRRMIALGKSLGETYHASYNGQTMNVLWEAMAGADDEGLLWSGYTDNYMRVTGRAASSTQDNMVNQITPTLLNNATADGLTGQILV